MKRKWTIIFFALFAFPVEACANVGVPIAPTVGIEIILYFPGLILLECLVIQYTLRIGWKKSFINSLKWNVVTTLIGFPVMLFMIYWIIYLVAISGIDVPQSLAAMGNFYWSFPPAMYPAKQPGSWYIFMTCAMLFWTVIAFALSVSVEEFLAKRSSVLIRVDPKKIHKTILAANIVSYTPLWVFTLIQNQIWR